MLAILSERFKAVLRDYTTPIAVVAEFYDSRHCLRLYKVFSVFPFELEHFLSNFDRSGFPTVTFVGLLPSEVSNQFKRYHILTL